MSEIQSTTKIYDETAAQIEAAYLGFARVYEVQHPRPVMQAQNTGVFGAKHVGLLLALIGSIIVSASHTIPVFLGVQTITDVTLGAELAIALAAFVMIEIGIVTFAYSATESAVNRDEVHRVRMFTNAGKWFVASVMFVANVYYVLQINVIPDDAGGAWSAIRVVIYLAVGASAPVVAFITGDILAIDVLKHRSRQTRAQEQYDAQLATWIEALNEQWKRDRRNWGANVDIQVSKPVSVQPSNVLPSYTERPSVRPSNGQDNGHSGASGYEYVSNASDKVRAYLVQFPEDANMNVRELADKIGVGKSTVSVVRADMKKRGEL
jgi:hypothetical protein